MDQSEKLSMPIKISEIKTRRGYGRKNKRKYETKSSHFSLIGTNAAGLTSKKESLFNVINIFTPSAILIQETKHKRKGALKLPGYQTFEKTRNDKGGAGLLTSVIEDLNPVLITSVNDDIEILTVQADLGKAKVRIINGYEPQEDDNHQSVLDFWQELEEEVIIL